ncbi:ArsC family transcriptional regulator [Sphingobacterium sp. ML3W]|uniref:arsenate reductase n=1 Tax=Sphingobacterium sp. ML3W TaxID=1538644 RepID=UPI0004F8E178|nr:arsenate reductase [Sphingobacterium sp. ML3W]AIM36604.1 ArsC family transcriptional regulator [Sphingobacterium sp. ML3W]
MLHVYGIKNCNTVKKAITWLADNQLDYTFHDYKKEGISEAKLIEWEKEISWEKLLNKKGTTWKKLDADEQAAVIDAKSANSVLAKNTSMIKRPVIEGGQQILVGFDEIEYASILK